MVGLGIGLLIAFPWQLCKSLHLLFWFEPLLVLLTK